MDTSVARKGDRCLFELLLYSGTKIDKCGEPSSLWRFTKMSWTEYGLKFLSKVGFNVTLNMAVPGSVPIIDLAQAAMNFYTGNVLGGVINTISGVSGLFTLGMSSAVIDAMLKSGKAAVVQTAKETAKIAGKKATKEVGEELAKQLAKGVISSSEKYVAVESTKILAKFACKEATKQVGQQVGKELAQGVLNNVVGEVISDGTMITVKSMGKTVLLSAVSSGGREVAKTIAGDVVEEVAKSVANSATKDATGMFLFELTKNAAKTAAEKEFMKHSTAMFFTDLGFSGVKGLGNYYS